MTKTVLVVDDEEPLRRLCARVLGRLGYRVLLADGVSSAVCLMEEAPNLLLTDLNFKDGDGLAVTRRFQELHPHAPVVMMTGDDARASSELCVRALLQKPFQIAELEAAIADALGIN